MHFTNPSVALTPLADNPGSLTDEGSSHRLLLIGHPNMALVAPRDGINQPRWQWRQWAVQNALSLGPCFANRHDSGFEGQQGLQPQEAEEQGLRLSVSCTVRNIPTVHCCVRRLRGSPCL